MSLPNQAHRACRRAVRSICAHAPYGAAQRRASRQRRLEARQEGASVTAWRQLRRRARAQQLRLVPQQLLHCLQRLCKEAAPLRFAQDAGHGREARARRAGARRRRQEAARKAVHAPAVALREREGEGLGRQALLGGLRGDAQREAEGGERAVADGAGAAAARRRAAQGHARGLAALGAGGGVHAHEGKGKERHGSRAWGRL